MGLFMGFPFPVGMKVASTEVNSPTVLFWGINGATSVTGSVLAIAVALAWGISTAFWVGTACYFIAAAAMAFLVLWRRPVTPAAT
jgi:hypothetical protein